MGTHRGRVCALLSSALLLLGVSGASAQNSLIQLSTLPGVTAPQARVGAAIDNICPKLAGTANSLNSAQLDLLARCSDMKTPGSRGLGTSVLPDVLGTVSPMNNTAEGNYAIETRSPQLQSVGFRLAALRLGATGISLNGLPLDGEPQTASATQPFELGQRGGGASADRNPFGGLSLFINGVGDFGSKAATSNEVGFNFHTAGLIAGADYRFTDALVAGLAFSYLRTNATIDFSLGEVASQSYGLALYGTYYVGPVYIDLLGGFTMNDYDTTRRIVYGPAPGFTGAAVDRTATGNTSGLQYTFNGGAGYDLHRGPVTVTPYGRLEYLHLRINGFTESGADGLDLTIQNQAVESLLTVLGGRVGYAINTPVGVVVPQVRAEWRHEVLNNKHSIKAQFANDPFNASFLISTDKPDRDYAGLGAGVSATFRKGMAAFFDFGTVVGLRGVSDYNFTAGARVEF